MAAGFEVVVSCLSTGRVRRKRFRSREQAREYADRWRPCGRRDKGFRVEVVRRPWPLARAGGGR